MKGITKKDISLSIVISLSYFVFWGIMVFVSTGGHFTYFIKGISVYWWQIVFVTFTNLSIHLLAIPFLKTRKSKWVWGALIVSSTLLLLIMVFSLWQQLGSKLSILPEQPENESSLDVSVKNLLFQLFGLGYFASIKFFVDSYRLKLKNQQLAVEKKTAELSYLKSQTNPHFLFNTLNNIYLLSREKSDLAPKTVLRLSEILRYMLYETEGKLVAVDKEIKIIEDYIELEKIRYDDTLKVSFLTEADDIKEEVPPLLMIPFVENAFKHGVAETIGTPFINIRLIIKEHTIQFSVENSTGKDEIENPAKEGIGIKNLRRQLELMFTDYQLTIENRGKTFYTGMFINLGSYA